jgi:hypothetical protein
MASKIGLFTGESMDGGFQILSRKECGNRGVFGPEKELLVATLDRAALDYYSVREDVRDAASEWLFSHSDENDLFSFSWVCDHLDLDVESVRTRVKQLNFPVSVSQTHRWLRRKVQSDFSKAA